MNAQPLFLADGKSAGVFFCESCKRVAAGKLAANECCKNWVCKRCNAKCGQYRTLCHDCSCKERDERDARILSEAELVEDYQGFVHCSGLGGPQDGYFPDIGELLDYCEEEEVDAPEFVHCCKPTVLCIHLSDILEGLDDNGYEDMTDNLSGVDALKDAIRTFNQQNREALTVWHVDYKRKVSTR